MSGRRAVRSILLASSVARPAKRWASACTLIGVLFAVAGCAAQLAYRDGKDFVAQGKVEEGLAKLQEAIAHAPRSAEYRVAYLQQRDRAVIGYLEQAERALDAGKWDRAEKLFRSALSLDAANDWALAGLRAVDTGQRHSRLMTEARTAWEKKDADGAQFRINQILAENPRHADALGLKRSMADKPAPAAAEAALAAA